MSRAALQHAPQSARTSAAIALHGGPANDAFEREADQAAEQVTSGENQRVAWSLSRVSLGAVQRECACAGKCDNCKKKEQQLQRKTAGSVGHSEAPPIVHEVLSSPGTPLDSRTRGFFEQRFGYDFSRVRIFNDSAAANSARAVSAHAYTVGEKVVFDEGRYAPWTATGQRLLAHELAHVVQQAGGSRSVNSAQGKALRSSAARRADHAPLLQRYEAGEHAQFGETGDILKQMAPKALDYKVKAGETPKRIADKFHISEADLIAANREKLKHWKLTNPDRVRDGFFAGDTIAIPATLNDALKEALKTREIALTVNGAPLEYGEVIAMGDFYESIADLLAAPEAELKELSRLIKLEKEGKGVPEAQRDAQWNAVTHGRYGKLALKNEKHFAPSNAAFAPVSGKSTGDHKTEWEANHKAAVESSQAGDKDKALATNAFADHFLTDAFSAGHIFNKRDAMEKFEGNLPRTPAGKFTAPSEAFFDGIATSAFTGPVKTAFSKFKTVACYSIFAKGHPEVPCDPFSVHADIDSVGVFSKLLQGIHMTRPDLMESAVAKSVHDKLNNLPGGLPVENNMGDKWPLSGDKTLNAQTTAVAKKAVAQSQMNVLSSFKIAGPMDFPGLFKKVWDYVPRPQKGTPEATVKDLVTTGTDPAKPGITGTVVKLIQDNFADIITELRSMGKLMPK
jgi:hypothetical protein